MKTSLSSHPWRPWRLGESTCRLDGSHQYGQVANPFVEDVPEG